MNTIDKADKLLYNSIPVQQLLTPNSLTIRMWNDYINQLRIQTNELTTFNKQLQEILNAWINGIESDINEINTSLDTMVETVVARINLSNYYVKAESDSRYELISQRDVTHYSKNTADSTFVKKTTTINGKALTSNIMLDTSDIKHDNEYLENILNLLQEQVDNETTRIEVLEGITLVTDYSNYKIWLENTNGDQLGDIIDLPLESVVVSGQYDSTDKKIILTLQNGSTTDFPVDDLIDGLVTKQYVDDVIDELEVKITDLNTSVQGVLNNESERSSAESLRESNESTRQSNETIRESNETLRASNEITRISNEGIRQANEIEREQWFNNAQATLEHKANTDGYYEDMTVGNANNLIVETGTIIDAQATSQSGDTYPDKANNTKGTGTFFPYGTNDFVTVENANEEIQKVYGHSYVKNNLVQNGNFVNTSYWQTNYGATFRVQNNKAYITPNAQFGGIFSSTRSINYIQGHKYLVSLDYDVSVNNWRIYSISTSTQYYLGPINIDTAKKTIRNIFTCNYTGDARFTFQYNGTSDTNVEVSFSNAMLIDLTLLDQALANTPNLTPEMVLKVYPDILNWEYNKGEMVNAEDFTYSSSEINQWDEEWELGDISSQAGLPVISSSSIRSKNYIPCFANTDYYIKAPTTSSITSTARVYLYFYDVSKNFIGYTLYGFTPNVIKKTPENCAFMKFIWQGTTYNHDIQICLHYTDTEIENTYHPYVAPSTKEIKFYGGIGRSAGSVCDEVDYVAKKRRKFVGRGLGSDLTLVRETEQGLKLYSFNDVKKLSGNILTNLGIPIVQSFVSSTETEEKMQISNALGITYVLLKANRDLSTFAFNYELATPVEEDIPQVEQNNILPCNDYGIESKSDGVVCGMKVLYQMNAKRTIFNNKADIETLKSSVGNIKLYKHYLRLSNDDSSRYAIRIAIDYYNNSDNSLKSFADLKNEIITKNITSIVVSGAIYDYVNHANCPAIRISVSNNKLVIQAQTVANNVPSNLTIQLDDISGLSAFTDEVIARVL